MGAHIIIGGGGGGGSRYNRVVTLQERVTLHYKTRGHIIMGGVTL